MTYARVRAVEFKLPRHTLTNETLEQAFPELPVARIFSKTGTAERHIAAPDECASDLAEEAAIKLFDSGVCTREGINAVLLCTQSPDYFLPTTACLLQARLGLPTRVAAFDFNLGCSGFWLRSRAGQGHDRKRAGEHRAAAHCRHLEQAPASRRSQRAHVVWRRGGRATLISADDSLAEAGIGPFVCGTDGRGGDHLIIRECGMRHAPSCDRPGGMPGPQHLSMNGPEIFNFTLETVPQCADDLYQRAGITVQDVDYFVFHQANGCMLEYLWQKMGIPAEKFALCVRDTGNTVSATIPIALHEGIKNGRIRPGMRVMLVGFGVGLPWAATLLRF